MLSFDVWCYGLAALSHLISMAIDSVAIVTVEGESSAYSDSLCTLVS